MKILFVIPSKGFGGAELFAVNLASYLSNNGFYPVIAFENCRENQKLLQECQSRQIRFIHTEIAELNVNSFPFKEQWRSFLRVIRFSWLLFKEKPDQVLIPLPWPVFGKSLVFTCGLWKKQTTVVFQLAPRIFKIPPLIKKALRWAKQRNQTWVAVSKQNASTLAQLFRLPEGAIHLIYNGVDPEDFHRKPAPVLAESNIRTRLNIPNDAILFLSMGRLSFQKGFDILIKALPHCKCLKNVFFAIAGEGEDRAKLQEMAKKLSVDDRIKFLGFQDDTASLLQNADCFLFPSRHEGLSFALLEAVNSGVFVLSSDAASNPEVIDHPARGLIFKSEDSTDLAEKIDRIILYFRKGLSLRKEVLPFPEHFRFHYMANCYVSLLKS